MRLLQRKYGAAAQPDLIEAIRNARLIILAVRPDAAAEVLQELDRALGSQCGSKVIVSVMAGLPIAWLRGQLAANVDWVRAMPSPRCESGKSLTALVFARRCSPSTRNVMKRFFESFGEVFEMPESQFNAFTVIYSPSHGVHALSALSEAGVKAGLHRRIALVAAAHALSSAEAAVKESGNIKKLVQQAATPGGTAEATMTGMDDAGYREAVAKGVQAGVARARSMAARNSK